MSPDERLTVEEFERVLNADRFATIHDVMRSAGLEDLADGSRATAAPTEHGDVELPDLPTRR